MPNVLGLYDPLFYANEALIQLEKALGLAGRVHRGYDATAQQKGSIIKIRKPGTFVAQDAPSTAQDVATEETEIRLDNWREVKFGLTDKELTFTKEDIIREHIRPAAYALADDLDQKLAALYKDVPWYYDQASGTIALADLAGVRKVLRDNKVPLERGNVHLMVDPTAEAGLIGLAEFNRVDASGTDETLREGTLARRFGMDIFVNQNTASHTPGVAADAAGALTANFAKGIAVISFNGVTANAPFKKGDSFSIAGDPQRYVFAEDKTADGTGLVSNVTIFPALKQAATSGAVVTVNLDAHVANLAFHRNAFALATAPLSEIGNGLGARIASVADPVTGLSLRSRVFYEGNDSKVFVALDILYGFKTLDPNLAARLRS